MNWYEQDKMTRNIYSNKYVDKKAFYITVGKTEGLITRIFKQLNELNKSVNQIVGALNANERKIN